jgi:hypothetical protein
MDVKEIASVATAAVVQPPPPEAHPQVQTQTPGAVQPTEPTTFALHPVVKVDTDGLVQLQLQDPQSGDVVYAVPSEQAVRQYRERDVSQGKGTAPAEQVAAAATGGSAAAAAAAGTLMPPAVGVQPQQQAKNNVALPQAVKPVEAQSGSKQSGSVRIKA